MKTILVQLIPEIFARCVELANAELEYYLFDRMLEITLQFLKNEEKMVRSSIYMAPYRMDSISFHNYLMKNILYLSNRKFFLFTQIKKKKQTKIGA